MLQVNGVDLSNAMHEEATKVFEQAQEPITVVLRRTKGQRVTSSDTSTQEDISNQLPSAAIPNDHRCFCQQLLETCKRSPGHFSSYIYRYA